MDCVVQIDASDYATGMLVFILDMTPEEFDKIKQQFLRDIGSLLRTNLMIAKDNDGADMVYPYYGVDGRVKRSILDNITFRFRRAASGK